MLKHIKLDQVFVIDIETVPQQADFKQLSPEFQELWEHKSRYQRNLEQSAEEFYEKAGIWAEFGKIVCISIGFFHLENKQIHLRLRSFIDHDEKKLLKDFIKLLNQQPSNCILCAHNGKEFDFPYLCRRMIINQLNIPVQLQLSGKKPWEIQHIDTLELWKFGDYKHYTSLQLLAAILNLPSPKSDIDGSQVGTIYHQTGNLKRISQYCQNDVICTAQILLRFKGLNPITEHNISIVK